MLLVDTSVWLETLLEQEKAEEALQFLAKAEPKLISLTDFAIHSIGIITWNLGKFYLFEEFLKDIVKHPETHTIKLENQELDRVVEACHQFNLDFDDAYQYVAAEKYDLILVSFDSDFDRTDRGRKTPAQALKFK